MWYSISQDPKPKYSSILWLYGSNSGHLERVQYKKDCGFSIFFPRFYTKIHTIPGLKGSSWYWRYVNNDINLNLDYVD